MYLPALSRHITTPVIVRVLRSTQDEVAEDHVDEGDNVDEDSWVRGVAFETFICPTTSRLIYVV